MIKIIHFAARYQNFEQAVYTGAPLQSQPLRPQEFIQFVDSVWGEAGPIAAKRTGFWLGGMAPDPGRGLMADFGLAADQVTFSPSPDLTGLLTKAKHALTNKTIDLAIVAVRDKLGAGALLLSRSVLPTPRVCAHLRAIATDPNPQEAVRQAFLQADFGPAHIGLLESSAYPQDNTLPTAYHDPEATLTCALSHSPQNTEMASLLKALLCLERRMTPPFPTWEKPKSTKIWEATPFYTAPKTSPWFNNQKVEYRSVAVHSLKENKETAHIILSEPSHHRENGKIHLNLKGERVYLFPISGQNQLQLIAGLKKLQNQIDIPIETLAYRTYSEYALSQDLGYTVVLISHNPKELQSEIERALDGIPEAFQSQKPWSTPRGSYFTPQPFGPGKIAFVYPGAFNSYVGLGQDLFQHFPNLHERLDKFLSNPGHSVAECLLYPRSLSPLDARDWKTREQNLADNPVAMIESGAVFAALYTMLIRDTFGVQPQAAFGYSLGEISMLWASGAWDFSDAGSEEWRSSPLYQKQLFGPMESVRQAWGLELPPENTDFWATYLLKAHVEDVRREVEKEPRVYLTLINLSNEVVIAGEPDGCQRVLDNLSCHSLKIPFNAVIHNEILHLEYERFVKLYTHPINNHPKMDFYSAAEYAPLELESEALAHSIAGMTTRTVDFPRLMDTVYESGVRVFVELGPQATCSRWIKRHFRGREHAVVPIDRRRGNDFDGIHKVLAMLASQRVGVNLEPLYQKSDDHESRGAGERRSEGGRVHEIVQSIIENTRSFALTPALSQGEREAGTSALTPTLTSDLTPTLSQGERGANIPLGDYIAQHAIRANQSQREFLKSRRIALQQAEQMLQMQIETARDVLGTLQNNSYIPVGQPPLYNASHINELAQGDPVACFGSDYAVYKNRRLPRLPNGDLLLMNRVIEIDGQQGQVQAGASLISEYNVSPKAWFYENSYLDMPYAILMEIALQPCGFLSAYLGSTLKQPETDFYFRNLDGEGEITRYVDLKGKTVTNEVTLLSSTKVKDTIIQRFTYELSVDGLPFYHGSASFGYFTIPALAKQASLPNDPKWEKLPPSSGETTFQVLDSELAKLSFLDGQITLVDGILYAKGKIRPKDWFFSCHFYQDPVMPGSLGVEAVRQAMLIYAQNTLSQNARPGLAPNQRTSWKYRGQITPSDNEFRLTIRLTEIRPDMIRGNASLWNDDGRIYEIENVGIGLKSKE